MEALFAKDYAILWAVALALALFIPARQLIWVLFMRRTQRQTGERPDDAEARRLKRRAGVTAALLCFVFSFLYTNHLFQT